jgi:hypothetical protein
LLVETILQNAEQHQHMRLYFLVSGFKIIGHGNPDNNLESHCTLSCIGTTEFIEDLELKKRSKTIQLAIRL